MVQCVRGYSMQDSHRGGRMRKLGAVAATGAVLALALAAWTRQPPPPAQGGGTIGGKGKFPAPKPASPRTRRTGGPSAKPKYQAWPPKRTCLVNPNGPLAKV